MRKYLKVLLDLAQDFFIFQGEALKAKQGNQNDDWSEVRAVLMGLQISLPGRRGFVKRSREAVYAVVELSASR
jgi:hypothetical protein